MLNPPLVIGLTGGIGSGKSEVTRRFAALGIEVIDADEIAREVVAPGQQALVEIALHFGPSTLTESGELDRAKLRQIIFNKPHEKHWLEELLHPLINKIVQQRLTQAGSPYVIFSSPLLLETQQCKLADRILVIDTTEALQLNRASRRDNTSNQQISAIMLNQMSRSDRLARADDVIHNLGDLNSLDAQVEARHQDYLLFARTHNQT